MNWSELNWLINAVLVATIGVMVRQFFAWQKDKREQEWAFERWQNEVNRSVAEIKAYLVPYIKKRLVLEKRDDEKS